MSKILSVSIAAYNAEAFIKECLDSLLVESVIDDLEVLVINDGSMDQTPVLVQKYVDLYPQTFVLVNKENGGWGSTVNKGMELATGKYFKLLDSDDRFYTENLESYIEQLKNTDVDLILTPYGIFDDETGEIYRMERYAFKNKVRYNYPKIADRMELQMHTMTVKREVIQRSGIKILKNCFYTDVQYVLELSCFIRSMLYFDKPIYCYRFGRNGQSCSMEGYKKHHTDHKRVTKYLMRYFTVNEIADTVKKAGYKRIKSMVKRQYKIYFSMGKEENQKLLATWESELKGTAFYKTKEKEINLNRMTHFKYVKQLGILAAWYEKIYHTVKRK